LEGGLHHTVGGLFGRLRSRFRRHLRGTLSAAISDLPFPVRHNVVQVFTGMLHPQSQFSPLGQQKAEFASLKRKYETLQADNEKLLRDLQVETYNLCEVFSLSTRLSKPPKPLSLPLESPWKRRRTQDQQPQNWAPQ
jgi:hypothetical protein